MYCANLIRPPDVESCNRQACEPVWVTGEWSEVTGGCLQKGPRPALLLVWNALAMSPLVISPPRQCSASCGQGYHQRLVSCSENEHDEHGHQSLSDCPGTPPESYKPCRLDPCPSAPAWRVGTWGPVSGPFIRMWRYLAGAGQEGGVFGVFFKCVLCSLFQCSASCGEGVMERVVQCLADAQGEAHACSQDDKPEARKVCSNPSCES